MKSKSLKMQLMMVLMLCFSYPIAAQESVTSYPSRVVTIVIPFVPGGPVERDTRIWAQKLSLDLGKPFVLDFKGGAGSTIGTAFVAKAVPDGYTLLSVSSGFSVNPALYQNLSFDTEKDLAPISHMRSVGSMLVVHPAFPAKNWPEYVAYVKANPGKVNFGTSGGGGVHHMAGAWLHSELKAKVTFIHYKGGGPVLLDVMAGRADAYPPTVSTALTQVKAGKLRVIAMMSIARSSLMPDIPTISEQGLPGFDFSSWGGVLTTGGTPAPIVNKLSNAMAKIAKDPEVIKYAAMDGTIMIGSTPEAFQRLITQEVQRWKKVVLENNIKLED
jgi:tripartite-type tricarboxylate transporter receptor subunit TctC